MRRLLALLAGLLVVGICFVGCGERQTAEQLYSEAQNCEQKGERFDAQGRIEESGEMFRKAVKTYERLVAKYPQAEKSPEALYKLGTLYMNNLKDADKSIDAYERLLDTYAGSSYSVQSLFMIGYRFANDVKDYEKAKEKYNEFLEKYPDHELALSVKWELENLGKDISEIEFLEDVAEEAEKQTK